MTIYFDKLTAQKTCISFRIVREYIVDRLEPANVKLYDYYQPELTVSTVSSNHFSSILKIESEKETIRNNRNDECFQNYKIASLCSSAEPVDEQATSNFRVDVAVNKVANSDKIEEPIAVYVKPETYYKTDATTITNELPDLTTIFATDQTVPTVPVTDERPIEVYL